MSDKKKIDKDLLHHLADLARVELGQDEEDHILESFRDIVDYFQKLEDVNVEGVDPVGGGNELMNVLREDNYDEKDKLPAKGAVDQLPEKDEDGYNKIPPVFSG